MLTNQQKANENWLNFDTPARRLTQSVALEESPVPGLMRTGVIVIAGLMALFIGWAAFAKVEEVASASGQIVPSGHIQTIQHLEGGIIRQILVEEGDLVIKGQPLMKLDDTTANADLGQMQARSSALTLQASRLRKFTSGASDKSVLTPEEQAILSSMIQARTSQQNVLRDQIAQKEKELGAIRSNRLALEKNVVLMKEEHDINLDMTEKGSGSKMAAMRSERELNALRGQLGEITNQEKQARDAINEARNRLQSLDDDLRQTALEKLGQVQAELDEVKKGLKKLESVASRTTLTAPVRGIVKGLTVHTIGAVAEPGRVLMEIVPVEEELLVEALVLPSDIGNVKVGQPVNVKISAYDFSRYGSLEGSLKSISASTFQTERGDTFYRAKIKLDKNYVGQDSTRNLVLPGMTAQAEIITGEKTILDYLLKPLHMVSQTAFRER